MSADSKVGIEPAISSQEWCAMGEEGKRAWLMAHGAGSALQSLGIDSPYSVQEQFETGGSIYPVLTMVQSPHGEGYNTALCGSIPSFTRGGAERKGYAGLRAMNGVSLVANSSLGSFNLEVADDYREPVTALYGDFFGELQAVTYMPDVNNGFFLSSDLMHLFLVITTKDGACVVLKTLNPDDLFLSKISDKAAINHRTSWHDERVSDYRGSMSQSGLFVPSGPEIVSMLQDYGMVRDVDR